MYDVKSLTIPYVNERKNFVKSEFLLVFLNENYPKFMFLVLFFLRFMYSTYRYMYLHMYCMWVSLYKKKCVYFVLSAFTSKLSCIVIVFEDYFYFSCMKNFVFTFSI